MTTTTAPRSELESTTESRQPYVLFFVGNQAYGLAVSFVQEVVPLPELVVLPTSPEFLAGFMNISGQAIPVVRVGRLLGTPSSDDGLYTPVILLRGLDCPLAIIVDRVHRVVKLAPHEIIRIADGATVNDFAEAMAECDDQQLIVIDPRRLLLSEEAACLEALRDTAQARIEQVEAVCA